MKLNLKAKQEYRDYAKNIRDNLDMVLISAKICDLFKDQDFYFIKNILGFYPFNNEVDLTALYSDRSKNWFLPKVEYSNKSMTIHYYREGDHLHKNRWGILEPVSNEELDIKKIDMTIVPALMADNYGNRIGYGAGFYDRFIPGLRQDCLKIAPVPEELIQDILPADHWDIPVDLIISQKQVYKVKK